MKVDLYTKAVLTIIASCLMWLCFTQSGLVATVHGQNSGYERVVVIGWESEGRFINLPAHNVLKTSPLPVVETR